ncbi:MAG: hypothetical protein WD795_13325 [Woeseia sp.]
MAGNQINDSLSRRRFIKSVSLAGGGNMMSGDRLVQLDPYKLDILRKITPSYGEAATPIDLFDTDIQTCFAMKVERPFDEWTVAAFFNPDLAEPIEKTFSLKRLGLDRTKTYLAYDFWRQQFRTRSFR